jgi:hypothetical protein
MKRMQSTVILSSDNIDDFNARVNNLEIVVPPRGKGRTADHTELYSLALLLRSPAVREDLAFPLEVIHRDRPDFLIRMPNREIGIEHVEAVSQNEALIASLREEGYGPECHFIRRSIPGEPLLTREEAIREIEADKPGPAWCGNSPEREWAEAMAYFVNRKIERMQKPGFETFDESWLLVYDNWRVPATDPYKSLAAFLAHTDASFLRTAVNRIYIVDDKHLWELSGGGSVHGTAQKDRLPTRMGRARGSPTGMGVQS